ncbi:MAG: immunoglobulin domain-containing protein [Planctomycetota bacterium]
MGHGFRLRQTAWMVAALAAVLAGPAAWAVEFTQTTVIAANDPTYDGQDIIVTGCTVTINGYHPFNSLLIRGNGVVTHSENNDAHVNFMDLAIAGSVTIEPGSRLDVSGKGYAAGFGPGAGGWVNFRSSGGGHGGNGGDSSTGAAGGAAYGSVLEPIEFGSGGGDPGNGGRGGGAVRLTVGGSLNVDGTFTANGGAAQTAAGGGGAGGSIYLTVGTLAGSGTITADGGSKGGYTEPGGGAGGRIAIHSVTSVFTGTLTTHGGNGWMRGGAGTIYRRLSGNPYGELWLDNNGNVGAATPIGSIDGDLTIGNSAWAYPTEVLNIGGDLLIAAVGTLTHLAGGPALELNVGGNATIAANGALSVNGKGYGGQAGPGAGGWVNGRAAGGGYGGRGGNSATGAVGGSMYGSLSSPDDLGSGGGGTTQGGAGGGAVHLVVNGVLTVDGQLSANGANATHADGGGGSGGSLWIEATTVAGAGTIGANGGNKGGYIEPGGGGGGRIAVYTCDLQMSGGQITVNGGTGWQNGQSGTFLHGSPFITITQQPAAQLVFFGSPVTFHVEANTTHGTLRYQWRKDEADLQNTGHYTAVTTHTLHIDAANYDDNGYYDVWLTDDCGNYVSDQARLIVPRPGDMNCDGAEDFGNINPFVLALSNPAGYTQQFPNCRLLQGDCNGDGLVDFGDINPFVRILTGQ